MLLHAWCSDWYHVTTPLTDYAMLHWVPVENRIRYKLCFLMHLAHTGRCPLSAISRRLSDLWSATIAQYVKPKLTLRDPTGICNVKRRGECKVAHPSNSAIWRDKNIILVYILNFRVKYLNGAIRNAARWNRKSEIQDGDWNNVITCLTANIHVSNTISTIIIHF